MFNNQPAIILYITKSADANVLDTVDRIHALLPSVKRMIPEGIDISVLSDRTTTLRASVHDMQITLALPMIVYFHRATIMAMPANILVVPLNGILMPAAAAALALAYIARPLANVPALIAGWALDATTGTVHILGSLRIADLRLPEPGAGASGLAISAIVLAILCARCSRALVAASLSLLLASAIYLVAAPA